MRGKGSQKQARLERLKNEIVDYLATSPGASAADIVAFLSNERKMRNHGLTTRKVGLFIPRYLSELINFRLDTSTGKRIYHLASLSHHHIHAPEPFRRFMDWGDLADAAVLFPSFSGEEDGFLPLFRWANPCGACSTPATRWD